MAAWMGRGPSRATWAAMLGMIPLVVVLGTSGAAAATGPKVDSFKVSNSSVGSADAKIVLTAKVTGAKTCTFSAAPHLAGLPKTVNCSSGKAKQAVTVPANSSTSPRSWVITLTVKGSGHKVTKTKKIRQAGKALSWGTQLIDPAQGIPNSVSCPTASFCVEVDDHGLASTSNGSSWSALKAIDLNSTNVLGYNPLLAVSCATTTFCVAVDEYGHAVTFNGKTWSTAKNIDAGRQLLAVSCPTTTFCAAVDGEGHALTYNGSKWSTPAAVGPDYPIVAVSCHSATFCVAVTQDKALTYNGTKWSGAQAVPTYQNAGLTAISCPTATFCVAADAEDEAFTDTSGTWSSATVIGMELDSLSCPTATSCIGVDDLGDYVSYNGATWSSETNVAPQVFQSVSCPTTTFCTVVDYGGSDDSQGYLGGGHALTFNGTTWSAPKLIDNTGGGGLTSVWS